MAEGFTRAQIDALGRRLADRAEREADLELLAKFQSRYVAPLEKTFSVIRDVLAMPEHADLGLTATNRLKTVDTIIDKLRRGTSLSTMQDIGGCRVVGDILLVQQDRLVADVLTKLPGAKVYDRRLKPMHGYRAVHIVPRIDAVPIEIQIRTESQDDWAQVYEALADTWGRGIRYGLAPLGATAEEIAERQLVINEWIAISTLEHKGEELMVAEREREMRFEPIRAAFERKGRRPTEEELTVAKDDLSIAREAQAVYQEISDRIRAVAQRMQ